MPNAAAAEEDTQPATDSRRRALPSPPTPEIGDLAEPEDPILAEVEAQKVARWRRGCELQDEADFAFFFASWQEAARAGLAVAKAWQKAGATRT